MKRRKPRVIEVTLEKAEARYQLDPHRRARVIPNKHKQYTRKARNRQGSEPSDFSAIVELEFKSNRRMPFGKPVDVFLHGVSIRPRVGEWTLLRRPMGDRPAGPVRDSIQHEAIHLAKLRSPTADCQSWHSMSLNWFTITWRIPIRYNEIS